MARDRAGNNLRKSSNLKTLNSTTNRQDFVGTVDRDDIYRFTLNSSSSININLSGMQRGANVNIELFAIKGNKNQVLKRIGNLAFSSFKPKDINRYFRRLGTSKRSGQKNENIKLDLQAGEYYLRVYQQQGNTRYKLRMTASAIVVPPPPLPPKDFAGNSLSAARNIVATSQPKTYQDWVDATDTDYYRFDLQVASGINLSLSNSAGVGLDLLDQSGNVVQSSTNNLDRNLNPGTYYLRASSLTGIGSNYNLSIKDSPAPITFITPRGDTETITLTTGGSDAPMSTTGASSFEAASLISLDDFRADSRFSGIDGRGFSVAILDTGIDLNHPFFGSDLDKNGIADRILYQYDFADRDGDASDRNGHGSNVSSIVGSQDAIYRGVAPGANIIHLKVFKDDGTGNFQYTEEALKWVAANATKYNIVSVNMSLGDTPKDIDGDGKADSGNYQVAQGLYDLDDELRLLARQGIVTVSAAGNDFFKHKVQGVAYPAADRNSLAVGAVWDSNNGSSGGSGGTDFTTAGDRITSFSQRHILLTDIFAPGALIPGAGTTGNVISQGGTSQASPHIAGVVALAQQLAVKTLGRRLTVSEFRDLLTRTGDVISDGDDENDNVPNTGQAYKRVNVQALAEAILGQVQTKLTPTWQKEFGNNSTSTEVNESFNQVQLDGSGNIYVLGEEDISPDGDLTSTVTFNVRKYDSSGNLLWTWSDPAGTFTNYASPPDAPTIAIDSAGNLYYERDTRLVKLASTGTTIWTRQVSALTGTSIRNITVNRTNTLHLVLAPSSTSNSSTVAKYDSNGNEIFRRSYTNIDGYGYQIRSDNAGNFYLAVNDEIAKYSSTGSFLWKQSVGASDLTTDAQGNVYTAGSNTNAYILTKFSSNGQFLWERTLQSSQGSATPYGIAVNAAGNVYVSGQAYSPSYPATWSGPFDNYAAWVALYDSNGSRLWTQEFFNATEPNRDLRENRLFLDVATDIYGNAYTAGYASYAYATNKVEDYWLVKLG